MARQSDTSRADELNRHREGRRNDQPPYGGDFSQSGGGYADHDHQGYPAGVGPRKLGRPEGDWDRPHPWSPWPGERGPDERIDARPDHRGFGPRIQRSDARIREDISERLMHDPHIDAGDIEIECTNGTVTLTGAVDARATKHRVEDVVAACPGVVDVANRLNVVRR